MMWVRTVRRSTGRGGRLVDKFMVPNLRFLVFGSGFGGGESPTIGQQENGDFAFGCASGRTVRCS